MELIRPIYNYPWRRVAGTVCVLIPIANALFLCPEWNGRWTNFLTAIWIAATIHVAALCLCMYRLLVTTLDGRPFERTFQLLAVLAWPLLGQSSHGARDADGQSVPALLMGDRDVLIAVVVIVASLLLIAFPRIWQSVPARGSSMSGE